MEEIELAEYSALRTEIERRAGIQWNVFALQITSAGAITSLAVSNASNFVLLLIVPLSSYMLGSRYILHDHHIKLIQRYFRESLSPRLSDRLQWDTWKSTASADSEADGRDRVTRWNPFHPTRLAFEGVAVLTLGAAIGSGLYRWLSDPPHWAVVTGFGLFTALGLLAIWQLHQRFTAATATT
ncbi:hypothetical protein AB0P21_18000 [Kribbella sp. NPDC056861]|uniref:hypothetical protein n=1 Tax=Kribbella sp. NPDC056861 TaxID=3154857 RepID=UPI0034276643